MALSTRLLALRRSPILLKLPPYLSALFVVVGVAWLLLLPLNEYSRQTYVSENAILPGQVHTCFGGSEHNIFRAYRQQVWSLAERSDHDRIAELKHELAVMGLKTATQDYSWSVAGEEIAGTNVYGVLQGPRADATEAMVLIAAWRNFDGDVNYSGVALALTLARYFKRWSIWSKDIILLVPDDSVYGPEAWVSAYHSTSSLATASRNVSALSLKAGALQAAVAIDYPAGPWGHRFDKLDILYDGINGALPNLDLLNTAVSIASSQMGIGCSLHNDVDHADDYPHRLRTIAKGLLTQSLGHSTGPHSAFMPYHVDAITMKTVGDGWHDEMSLGRTTESLVRSINNILEHLHQSFFFYILLNTNRFVSIGNYLPAAMILAGSFTITALALWVKSGKLTPAPVATTEPQGTRMENRGKTRRLEKMEVIQEGDATVLIPKSELETVERKIFLPATLVLAVHLAGLIPLSLLNSLPKSYLSPTLFLILLSTLTLPVLLARFLSTLPIQQTELVQSFSLLLFAAVLSTLATINFSLAFVIALLASPLAFIRTLPSLALRQIPMEKTTPGAKGQTSTRGKSPPLSVDEFQTFLSRLVVVLPVSALYIAIAPPVLLYAAASGLGGIARLSGLGGVAVNGFGVGVEAMLVQLARGWVAQGAWTGLVVWGLWWPAWVIGGAVLGRGCFS